MFGAVAIQGAHADLLKGLENAARDENAYTDVWVSPPGAYNLLRTAPFASSQQAELSVCRECAGFASTVAACWTGVSVRSG